MAVTIEDLLREYFDQVEDELFNEIEAEEQRLQAAAAEGNKGCLLKDHKMNTSNETVADEQNLRIEDQNDKERHTTGGSSQDLSNSSSYYKDFCNSLYESWAAIDQDQAEIKKKSLPDVTSPTIPDIEMREQLSNTSHDAYDTEIIGHSSDNHSKGLTTLDRDGNKNIDGDKDENVSEVIQDKSPSMIEDSQEDSNARNGSSEKSTTQSNYCNAKINDMQTPKKTNEDRKSTDLNLENSAVVNTDSAEIVHQSPVVSCQSGLKRKASEIDSDRPEKFKSLKTSEMSSPVLPVYDNIKVKQEIISNDDDGKETSSKSSLKISTVKKEVDKSVVQDNRTVQNSDNEKPCNIESGRCYICRNCGKSFKQCSCKKSPGSIRSGLEKSELKFMSLQERVQRIASKARDNMKVNEKDECSIDEVDKKISSSPSDQDGAKEDGYLLQSAERVKKLVELKKKYKCIECLEQFLTESALECHSKIHYALDDSQLANIDQKSSMVAINDLNNTGKQEIDASCVYKCNICDQMYSDVNRWKKHEKKCAFNREDEMLSNSDDGNYTCDKCDQQFEDNRSLENHVAECKCSSPKKKCLLQEHYDYPCFKCSACDGFKTNNFREVRRHIIDHLYAALCGEGPVLTLNITVRARMTCLLCQSRFEDGLNEQPTFILATSTVRHAELHLCLNCGKGVCQAKGCGDAYENDECKTLTPSKRTLRSNKDKSRLVLKNAECKVKKTANLFDCEKCCYSCSRKDLLQLHIDAVHHKKGDLIKGSKPLISVVHDVKYITDKSDLQVTRRLASPPKKQNSPMTHKDCKDGVHKISKLKGAYCEYCESQFETNEECKDHVRYQHTKHKCNFCNQTFHTDCETKSHILLSHKSGEGYRGKSDNGKSPIMRLYTNTTNTTKKQKHSVVSDDDRLICRNCNAYFDTEEKHKSHALNCSVDKEFICKTCDENFNSELKLKSHIQKVHSKSFREYNADYDDDESKWPCKFCSKKFTKKKKLKMHVFEHLRSLDKQL